MTVFAMLMVFTVITVAASRFHLAVPVAITVALIIATMKGSMVAGVFMHLSHEKQWIYGALMLTVVFFIVLLFLPLFTSLDGLAIGSAWTRREAAGIDMSLRAFHLLFIALSIVLAAFLAAWAADSTGPATMPLTWAPAWRRSGAPRGSRCTPPRFSGRRGECSRVRLTR